MSTEVSERRPTIMEVARLAGVSHQTVSRYINFDGEGMKEATRQRVAAAVAELDYRPNLAARAMRARKTRRLALLLPLGAATGSLDMLAGATAAAEGAGYTLEAVTLGGSSLRPARVLEMADSGLYEGVVSTTPLGVGDLSYGTSRCPIVVMPDYDDEMRGIGDLADARPIKDIVERLAQDGHRRFLHIAGDQAYASGRNRRQVYEDTVERLGLRSFGVVVAQDWSPWTAHRALVELPADSGVTAVVCGNDRMAAGAIRGAAERGWRVPDDLSVSGWDNDTVAAIMPPSITSVSTDFAELGRRAIFHLLTVLGRNDAAPSGESSLMQVHWRESTGLAPQRRGRTS